MARLEELRRFVGERPLDPFPRYALALELKSSGKLEDAEREFSEILTKFPDYVPAYLHAGSVLAALGRKDDAVEVLKKGIRASLEKGDFHAKGELESALSELCDVVSVARQS